jgi:hypothetical protein
LKPVRRLPIPVVSPCRLIGAAAALAGNCGDAIFIGAIDGRVSWFPSGGQASPSAHGFTTNIAMDSIRPPLTVSLLVNEQSSVTLRPNAVFAVTWSSSNASACAGSIQIGNSQTKPWEGITPNSSGSARGSAPVDGVIYTLTCSGFDGQLITRTAKVLITAPPELTQLPDPPGAPVGDVRREMEPFYAAAGPDVVGWLSDDSLGVYLYGSQATAVLQGTGSIIGESIVGHQNIPCNSVAFLDDLGVILVAGQSNAGNSAQADADGKFYASSSPVYNLNIDDAKCYIAKAPLLGANGGAQSFALPLADDLIKAGVFKAILLVPIAVSGSFIEQWRPSANFLFKRFETAISDLRNIGLQPSLILWHQGESNAGSYICSDTLDGEPLTVTPAIALAGTLNWMQSFFEIVARIRGLRVDAPIFVAVATSSGNPTISREIQLAQTKVTDPAWGIYPGPNTDAMEFSLRRSDDQCHFSSEGNIAHAQLWSDILQRYVASHSLPPSVIAKSQSQSA